MFKASVNKVMRHGLLMRYTHALLIQVSQSVACKATIQSNMSLPLALMNHDRGCDQFPLPRVLSQMMGCAAPVLRRLLVCFKRG